MHRTDQRPQRTERVGGLNNNDGHSRAMMETENHATGSDSNSGNSLHKA